MLSLLGDRDRGLPVSEALDLHHGMGVLGQVVHAVLEPDPIHRLLCGSTLDEGVLAEHADHRAHLASISTINRAPLTTARAYPETARAAA